MDAIEKKHGKLNRGQKRWPFNVLQVIIMGRDLNKEEDHDLSPLIASGHIVTHGPSTPWKDFLRYIESSRCATHQSSPPMNVIT